jgi:hypothetical protein
VRQLFPAAETYTVILAPVTAAFFERIGEETWSAALRTLSIHHSHFNVGDIIAVLNPELESPFMMPSVECGRGHKTNGQISPDRKWLAYASDESGDWEIYRVKTTFASITRTAT